MLPGMPESLDPNQILLKYRGWLFKMAAVYMPWNMSEHADLAQEGFVAMWRAMQTYDPSQGSLPQWLTTAARLRMSECARRENWTGNQGKRGHVREKPAEPVDTSDPLRDKCHIEIADGVELAYHRGEIGRVLSGFSPSVRSALYRKFWLDETVPRGMWCRAIPELQEKLAHLRAEYA
jgi:DNA-directed RNA polymerase specialized sigma24 family protein